jgi:raffinose/stachyose/melibiose transport system substrate-binding protein
MGTDGNFRRHRRPRAGAVAAVLACAALIGACGGGTDEAGDDDQGDGGAKVTLKAVVVADEQKPFETARKAFEAANPDIRIDASYAPTDQVQTSLRARLAAGNAPDIHTVWPGNGSSMAMAQLAQANLLADISGQEWIDAIPDDFQQLLGTDGKTLMWAPGMAVIGAIYNKEVFEKAGVEVPTTWPELLKACETFKSKGITPIALGNQTPWVTQLINYAIAPSIAFGENPNLAQDMLDGKATFSNSGWRQTFERYMELDKDGFFNDNPNGTTVEQMYDQVAGGDAAMLVSVSAVLPMVQDAAKGRAEIGLFPFPAADNPDDLKIPAGVSAGFGVAANSKHPEEAKKFLEFLGSEDTAATFAKELANIPLSATADTKVEPELLQQFVPYVAEGRSVPFMDQQWPNAEIQPVHFAVVQELFAGKTTIDEALKKLDEAYQKN